MSHDIRLSISFRDCRKRKKLFRKFGAVGVLALVDLWAGVAVSRPEGILHGWDSEDIALEGNYDGDHELFVAELVNLKLLDFSDGIYSVHNWTKNQPWVADSKLRSESARKRFYGAGLKLQ